MLIYRHIKEIAVIVAKRIAQKEEGNPDGSPMSFTPATDSEFAVSIMSVGIDTNNEHAVASKNVIRHVVKINPQWRSPVL